MIYTEKGWIDYNYIIKLNNIINILVGGRGIGKTYGLLENLFYLNSNGKIFYLRRTQEEIETCCNNELNPFNELNEKYNRNIHFEKEKKLYKIVENENILGMAGSLSSVGKIRGMSGYDFTNLIFDECIKPLNARRIMKDEGYEFLNLYETLNRNREIIGKKPLKAFLLSNSNFMGNDLFLTFNLISVATNIKKKNNYPGIYQKNGLLYVDFGNSSIISDKKKNSVIYKVSNNLEYNNMALSNDFVFENYTSHIKKVSLREYKPVCTIYNFTIYEHKSKNEFFVSHHYSGSPIKYGTDYMSIEKFKKDMGWIYLYYLNDVVYFENYELEILLTKLLK